MPKCKKKKRQQYTSMIIKPIDDLSERNLYNGNSDLSFSSQLKQSLRIYLHMPKDISYIIFEYAKEEKHFCIGLTSLIYSKCMNFALKSQPYCIDCQEKMKTWLYCVHGISMNLCCYKCNTCSYEPNKCQDQNCLSYNQSLNQSLNQVDDYYDKYENYDDYDNFY